MKKTVIVLAAVLALSLALAACGEKPAESTAAKTTAAPEVKTTAAPETLPNTDPVIISTGEAPGGETKAPEESKEETQPEPPTEATETAPASGISAEDFVIVYKGVELRPGDAFDPEAVRDQLGTPEIEQGQACIGGGYDTNYYYEDGLVGVLTLAKDGQQIIYDIYTDVEGFSTARGAVIGTTTREALQAIYGAPFSSAAAADKYSLDGTVTLSFSFSGGILSEIDLIDESVS